MIAFNSSESIFSNFQNKDYGIYSDQNMSIFQQRYMLNQCQIVFQYNKFYQNIEGHKQSNVYNQNLSRPQMMGQYKNTCELRKFVNECSHYTEKNMDQFIGRANSELEDWFDKKNSICKPCYQKFKVFFAGRVNEVKQQKEPCVQSFQNSISLLFRVILNIFFRIVYSKNENELIGSSLKQEEV